MQFIWPWRFKLKCTFHHLVYQSRTSIGWKIELKVTRYPLIQLLRYYIWEWKNVGPTYNMENCLETLHLSRTWVWSLTSMSQLYDIPITRANRPGLHYKNCVKGAWSHSIWYLCNHLEFHVWFRGLHFLNDINRLLYSRCVQPTGCMWSWTATSLYSFNMILVIFI